MEYFLGFLFIVCIVSMIYWIIKLVQATNEKKELEKKLEEVKKEEMQKEMLLDLAAVYIQELIEDLNFDFSLGLYDGDIYAISRAEFPYQELAKYIDNDFPSLDEFKSKMFQKLSVFLNGFAITYDKKEIIKCEMSESLDTLDDADIAFLAQTFSETIPDEIYFLRGKINYTLAVLSFVQSIAEKTNDTYLSDKVEEIKIKRGYA